MKSQTPNSLCFFVLLEFQYIKTGRGIFVFFHVMEHIPGLGNVPKLKLRQINFLSYGHRGGEIPGGLPLKKYRVTRQKFSIRDTKILFCAHGLKCISPFEDPILKQQVISCPDFF